MTKTVNGVVTTYYYQGSLLISEYTDTETIVYIYDSKGLPIGFRYRTSTYADGGWDTYWYGRNPIGDIVSVYSSSAVKLVSYYYDAWGNTTIFYSNNGSSTTAVKNNLTYRGYYYDSDISMYYLQSRYYDSNTGRFINADSILVDSLLGYNLFAYCDNNPVNRVDPTGYFADYVDFDDNYDFLDDPDKFAGGGSSSGSGNSGASIGTGGSCSNSTNGKVNSNSSNPLPKNGTTVDSSTGLQMAIDFLGDGYIEMSSDRYVSSDGVRQIRIANADILGLHGGGPHINFDLLSPKYKSVHVYIYL